MVNKTKTWEIAISDEEKASKNYKFKRIANMALRQHMIEASYDEQNPVDEIKDNQMEYESPFQIKTIKGKPTSGLSFGPEVTLSMKVRSFKGHGQISESKYSASQI